MMIMNNVKIEADCPGTIIVGDVVFHIKRMNENHLTIGIDAPKDQKITTSWPRKSKTVET